MNWPHLSQMSFSSGPVTVTSAGHRYIHDSQSPEGGWVGAVLGEMGMW